MRDAVQHAADDVLRPFRRVGRHGGEAPHFFGDDGEAMPVIAGACRFHRRVQREQLGLARQLLDERHERADLFRGLRQLLDRRGVRFDVARQRC